MHPGSPPLAEREPAAGESESESRFLQQVAEPLEIIFSCRLKPPPPPPPPNVHTLVQTHSPLIRRNVSCSRCSRAMLPWR